MSKDLFYFNRQDRIATIVLLAIIVAIMTVRMNMPAPARDSSAVIVDSIRLSWTYTARDTVVRRNRTSVNGKRQPVMYNDRKGTASVIVTDTVHDSVRVPRFRVKTRPVGRIDLNAADSLQLTGLPGIGAWTAQKIMRYRDDLGGFVSEEQLLEIEGLPDSLLQWFIVTDTVPVVRIRVNMSSVSELRRHPYLNFYQARAIVELRRDRGKVQGPGQLSLLEEFTERDLERLEPYLDYE